MWHLKVIAKRQRLSLSAAFVGKSRVMSLHWYPAMCVTSQKNQKRVFSKSTILDGALFALLLQTTSPKNKGAGLLTMEAHDVTVIASCRFP